MLDGLKNFWSHKILPLAYDDSLSYFEVLCKLTSKINEVIDIVNNDEHPDPDILSNAISGSINFNRKYWLDTNGFVDAQGNGMRRPNGFTLDDDNWYLFYVNATDTEQKLVIINKTTYATQYKTFTTLEHAGTAVAYGGNIYVTTGSQNGGIYKINVATWIPMKLNTDVQIGSLAYDKVKHKWYGRGGLSSDTSDVIYELVENGNTFESTVLFVSENPCDHSVAQSMTANDGILYRGFSNPNVIVSYDIAKKEIKNIINVDFRADGILPLGETQDLEYYNNELHILGHNKVMVTGMNYIDVIGSYNPTIGSVIESFDTPEYPSEIHVDDTVSGANIYSATGWVSAYDTAPFKTLWEAVECAVGMYERTGIKSNILIHNHGNSYGSVHIDGQSVRRINEVNSTSANPTYYYVDNLVVIGGDTTIYHALFKGVTGRDDIAFRLFGGNVSLEECGFLYLADANDGGHLMSVNNGGNLFVKKLTEMPSGYDGALWTTSQLAAKNIDEHKTYIGAYWDKNNNSISDVSGDVSEVKGRLSNLIDTTKRSKVYVGNLDDIAENSTYSFNTATSGTSGFPSDLDGIYIVETEVSADSVNRRSQRIYPMTDHRTENKDTIVYRNMVSEETGWRDWEVLINETRLNSDLTTFKPNTFKIITTSPSVKTNELGTVTVSKPNSSAILINVLTNDGNYWSRIYTDTAIGISKYDMTSANYVNFNLTCYWAIPNS